MNAQTYIFHIFDPWARLTFDVLVASRMLNTGVVRYFVLKYSLCNGTMYAWYSSITIQSFAGDSKGVCIQQKISKLRSKFPSSHQRNLRKEKEGSISSWFSGKYTAKQKLSIQVGNSQVLYPRRRT
jgi:hypothetical protein